MHGLKGLAGIEVDSWWLECWGGVGRRDVGWPRGLGVSGQLGRVCVVDAKGLSSANAGVEERR